MMQAFLVRILSMTRPLANELEQYGATEAQEQAFFKFLDGLTERVRGPERDRPSFAYFLMHVDEIFPSLLGDKAFFDLLIDTLQVERAAYRELHDYIKAQQWMNT